MGVLLLGNQIAGLYALDLYILVRDFRRAYKRRAFISEGSYNWNRKGTSKQATATVLIQCLILLAFTGVLSYKIVSGGSLLPGETYDRIYFVVNR